MADAYMDLLSEGFLGYASMYPRMMADDSMSTIISLIPLMKKFTTLLVNFKWDNSFEKS